MHAHLNFISASPVSDKLPYRLHVSHGPSGRAHRRLRRRDCGRHPHRGALGRNGWRGKCLEQLHAETEERGKDGSHFSSLKKRKEQTSLKPLEGTSIKYSARQDRQ